MASEIIIPLIFWSSIPLSLLASVFGILKSKYWLVLLGAFLFVPLAYYVNGSPSLHGLAILLPLFQVGSAAALHEGYRRWAWFLLLPAFMTVLWMFVVIMYYQFFFRN